MPCAVFVERARRLERFVGCGDYDAGDNGGIVVSDELLFGILEHRRYRSRGRFELERCCLM